MTKVKSLIKWDQLAMYMISFIEIIVEWQQEWDESGEGKSVGGGRQYQIGTFEIAICKRGRMGG